MFYMNTAKQNRNEKSSLLMWTALILMFFVIQAMLWTFAISFTLRDPSHTVVPGYDEQALNWDIVKKQRDASELLGWKADFEIDSTGDIHGNRTVTIGLEGRDVKPIENAILLVEAFHVGRAAEVQHLSMKPVGPGVYSATMQVRNSGQWRFSGTATIDEKQFLFEEQIKIESNRNL